MSKKMIVSLTEEEKKKEEFMFNFEPKIGNYDRVKFLQTMPSQTKTIIVERIPKINIKKTELKLKEFSMDAIGKKHGNTKEKLIINKVRKEHKKEYLDLGHGYKIRHRIGSAYSIFYKMIVNHGHFSEFIETIEKTDCSVAENAMHVFNLIAIPVDKVTEYCHESPEWNPILEKKRESKGKKSLIEEMISVCACSYSSFLKKKQGNKNVQKFKEAGIIFRKYKKYVMLYPEKYEEKINEVLVQAEWSK